MADGPGPTSRTASLGGSSSASLLYGLVFLAFVDNFALLPVLGPYARSLGATAAAMGLVVAAYSVTNIAGNVVGGLLADRVTPRSVLGAAFVACAVLLTAYATVGSVSGLVAIRLGHGFAGGVLTPVVLALVAARGGSGLGRRMGRAGAAIGGAAVVAPALAGVVRGAMGFTGVFVVVGLLLLLGACLALTLRVPVGDAIRVDAVGSSLGQRPRFRAALVAIFAFTASLGTIATFLPDRIDRAGLGPGGGGAAFTLLAGVAVLVMLSPASGRLDTRGPTGAMLTGLATFVGALVLAGAAEQIWSLLLACVVFGLGFGLLFPAATTAVADASPHAARGRAFGVLAACYSLGFVLGPPISGLADDVGLADPLHAAAVICAGCLAVVARTVTHRPRP